MERLVPWAALFIAGIGCGLLTCAALVVRSKRLVPVALLATLMASSLLASCTAVWRVTPRLDAIIAATFIGLGACVGGYALGSAMLYSVARPHPARAEVASPAAESELGIVVLSDAEPEEYEPGAVTETLVRHEDADAPLPPEFAKPLVYVAERSRYGRLGGSPARATVREVARSLEQSLQSAGMTAAVVPAFCDEGSLPDALRHLASGGARRIVVTLLSVAETAELSRALADLGLRDAAGPDTRVETTDALWCSHRLTEMLASRIAAEVPTAGEQVGVCLTSPGEPDELQSRNQKAVEQTTFFAERLRSELASRGIAPERIRRAYLQWEEPDVPEAARHLAALGAKRILFVPLIFPAETIQTLLDLRYAAEQSAHDTGAESVVLPAWGDDPAVVEALQELAVAAAQRMDGAH